MTGSMRFQVYVTLLQRIYQKYMSKEMQRETGKNSNLYGTLKTYTSVWYEFAKYVKNEIGIKDLQKVRENDVIKFLDMKINSGLSEKRIQVISAALGKLEVALKLVAEEFGNHNPNDYNWKKSRIEMVRTARKDGIFGEKKDYTRAYKNPIALNQNLKSYKHQLASKIQIQGGARLDPLVKGIRETVIVSPNKMKTNGLGHIEQVRPGAFNQFQGLSIDKFTGKEVGHILTVEKGGKPGLVMLDKNTYLEIQRYIDENKVLKVNPDVYRNDLKQAAKASGQKYEGSHGQRWNYAQFRMKDLQEHGMGFEAAKQQVSWEMKHYRSEITEHYLQGESDSDWMDKIKILNTQVA